ncbi:MAG: hybrid sensor histidine kinase/response regulator [Prevotella sp.]|nr:hybrid sensor histidine kinase/response regulator [Prevotella sp.]
MDKSSGFWGIPLKVAFGYAVLLAVSAFAVVLVWDYSRSALRLTDIARRTDMRREAMDGLVHGILRMENAERAIFMGHTGRGDGYCRLTDTVIARADSLAALLSDTLQRRRVDTLRTLLVSKRENTLLLLKAMADDARASLYERKAARLRSGRDSMVVHRDMARKVDEKRVTYVVEKTSPTFFGRLADAFRRSRSDTTATTVDTVAAGTDSIRQRIDLAEPVAEVLTDVGRAEENMRRDRRDRIRRRSEALLATGMQLTERTERLMDDIGRAETHRMRQQAVRNGDNRREATVRVWLLAALAVAVATVSFVFVWRDNRRAERYRRSLDEARRRAENLLQQRERLLLTVSHDIKSPVASISGFTELLMPHVSGDRPRAFLDNIRSSALHLLRLVGALLDYHRLEQGRVEVRSVSFSPAQLVADCVESFRLRAEEKGLAVVYSCATTMPPTCLGDAFRIRQIAENLIGNAVKYTDSGRVTVTADVSSGRFLLTVADTGRGMTEEESRRIYDAFTRLPGAQGIDGVGLGLSITRELVTLLDGTIGLDTAPGRGSTFTVSIPVSVPAAAASASASSSLSSSASSAPSSSLSPSSSLYSSSPSATAGPALSGHRRVLAVDDDALQLQLLREMVSSLSASRWEVVTCSDVDGMWSAVATGRFSMLFTDIEMPAMNGFEIAARLGDAVPAGCRLPVVAMTAHDAISDDDFLRAGFAACLHKPFTAAELTEVILRVMETDEYDRIMSPETSDMVSALSPSSSNSPSSCVLSPSGPASSLRFSALAAFADGDEDAVMEIMTSFRTQTMADVAALKRAAGTKDIQAAGALAHRLIPVFTMIESPAVSAMRRLADARRAEEVPKEWSEWCREVMEEMERAVAAVP